MEHAFVFLADGLEEIEGLTVVDILRRGGIETTTVSITDHREVVGSHQIPILADVIFAEADFDKGTLFVLPGGMPGTKYLGAHQGLCSLLKKAKADGKRIAAICAAPSVFGDLGLLAGETACCYPGMEPRLAGASVVYEEVAVSGQVTTSRGMGTAIPFALSLLGQLTDEKTAQDMAEGIVYRTCQG